VLKQIAGGMVWGASLANALGIVARSLETSRGHMHAGANSLTARHETEHNRHVLFMRVLLCSAFAFALCIPAWSQPSVDFEVASIKSSTTPPGRGLLSLREDIKTEPARLSMGNVSLSTAVRWAYKIGVYEISGPGWIDQQRYDITATAAEPVSEDQLRGMLQNLLKDRFKLMSHRQVKDVSGYALVKGKKDLKLIEIAGEGGGEGSMTGAGLMFEGHKMPLSRLTDILASALKTPVRDMTGLTGNYDFKLDMRPYLSSVQPGQPLDLAGIAISALEDELGLRLESRKFPMDVLVVDSAERQPSEN